MLLGGHWDESAKTFRYQGWFKLDVGDTGGYLAHVYDCVRVIIDRATWNATFNVSDSALVVAEPNSTTVTATIRQTNDWQYVEAIYDLDTIRLVTEVDDDGAPGIGDWVIDPAKTNVYIGCRKNKNRYVGWMDDMKISRVEEICPEHDLTDDCAVDLRDFSVIAADWMKCTDPEGAGCVEISP